MLANTEYKHQQATIAYFVASTVEFFVCVGAFSRKRAVKEKKITAAIWATVHIFCGNGYPLNVSPWHHIIQEVWAAKHLRSSQWVGVGEGSQLDLLREK